MSYVGGINQINTFETSNTTRTHHYWVPENPIINPGNAESPRANLGDTSNASVSGSANGDARMNQRQQQKRIVSFRGGNTNDDDENVVMRCGGVMFSFNNVGIGTNDAVGHATSRIFTCEVSASSPLTTVNMTMATRA